MAGKTASRTCVVCVKAERNIWLHWLYRYWKYDILSLDCFIVGQSFWDERAGNSKEERNEEETNAAG